jgi:hypothetical protein
MEMPAARKAETILNNARSKNADELQKDKITREWKKQQG